MFERNLLNLDNRSYLNLPNLRIIYIPRLLNKLVKLISFNKIDLAYPKLKNHPFEVLIGGSMFIEGRSSENYLNINKKNFYLGCNFGPYQTERYLKKYYEIFSKVNDVCFRDEYSYNLFKDLPNVRMASDIVFSLPELDHLHLSEYEQKPYVVISAMDFAQNNLEGREGEYLNFLHHVIKKFILQKYQIKLISFCKKDGDESGIKKIQNLHFTEFEKTQISTYCYYGDILEVLQIFKNAAAIAEPFFAATELFTAAIIFLVSASKRTNLALTSSNFSYSIFSLFSVFRVAIEEFTLSVISLNFSTLSPKGRPLSRSVSIVPASSSKVINSFENELSLFFIYSLEYFVCAIV